MANLSAEPFDHYIPRGPLNEAPEVVVAVAAVWLRAAKVARDPHRLSPYMRPVRSAT
jgi:hypothetical protein